MRRTKDIGRFFLIFSLLIMAGSASRSHPATAAEINRVVLATGTFMGGYYLLGGAICAEVNRSGRLRCAIETSKGQVANLQSLHAGQVNLALAQSDWVYHAQAGHADPFKGDQAFGDLQGLISLSGAPLALLTRPGSGVKGIEDLPGKRIDIGRSGSARRALMDDMMSAMEWDLGKFKLASELAEIDAIKALCSGHIDIVALTGFTPDRDVELAVKTCALEFVPVSAASREKIVKLKPYYSAITIPAGSYPGLKKDVPSLGTRVVLVATTRLQEKDAYVIVRTVTESLQKIRDLHPGLASIDRSSIASGGIAVPLHAGAQRFFREAKLH